jgi:hypothetical protein
MTNANKGPTKTIIDLNAIQLYCVDCDRWKATTPFDAGIEGWTDVGPSPSYWFDKNIWTHLGWCPECSAAKKKATTTYRWTRRTIDTKDLTGKRETR